MHKATGQAEIKLLNCKPFLERKVLKRVLKVKNKLLCKLTSPANQRLKPSSLSKKNFLRLQRVSC